MIASLSIPWGFNKGDEDLGGYHLVWPRDLVETAVGFLAAGATLDALRVLRYLESTQEADGHWAQNMWLDGRPYWGGLQMDEAAFPILLVDMLRREARFALSDMNRWWDMVSRAAGFLVRNGPVTQQDRWEEDAGYSPFTLAVEVSSVANRFSNVTFVRASLLKSLASWARCSASIRAFFSSSTALNSIPASGTPFRPSNFTATEGPASFRRAPSSLISARTLP